MIYLDNAATSFPKPPQVAQAMARFLEQEAANPGRAGHRMAVAVERAIEDLRLKLTRLFDGDDPHRMIFTMNCTDGLNMAIKGVVQGMVASGKTVPHVITTVIEHNSVNRPLQAMLDQKQITLTRVNCDDHGQVDPDDIRRAIVPATVLIVMTHASNVLGTVQDVTAIGQISQEHDLLFCIDAAQTAGIVPISIQQMQIDLLAFPGHKSLLGPTGTGGLYVGSRIVAARMRPWREGGTGGDSAMPAQPTEYPHYLEAGTPNTVGAAGLAAAVDYLAEHSMIGHLAHEQSLCARLIERFSSDRRFRIYGPHNAQQCVGTLSLSIDGLEAPDVASILDDSFQIAVRSGLHCAPYTHRRIGTFASGTVRISPGIFNSEDDVDRLIDALDQISG